MSDGGSDRRIINRNLDNGGRGFGDGGKRTTRKTREAKRKRTFDRVPEKRRRRRVGRNTENVFRERQRDAAAPSRCGTAARYCCRCTAIWRTNRFTLRLPFYFERYIFLDFIANLDSVVPDAMDVLWILFVFGRLYREVFTEIRLIDNSLLKITNCSSSFPQLNNNK